MADQRAVAHHRGQFAGWAIVYALAVAYSSLVVGPTGFHFVPLAPETAWRIFKATPYVVNGSDQRPDWMANLLMLVPLGWLATGAFWPRRDSLRWLAAGAALCCCLIFVLAIKYLQLFFPPRTVTLNYIEAQSLGSLFGVGLFWLTYNRRLAWQRGLRGGGRTPLMIACGIYAAALLFFSVSFRLCTQRRGFSRAGGGAAAHGAVVARRRAANNASRPRRDGRCCGDNSPGGAAGA
jgi:hypothetical protein